jgi:hypothetical protein
MLIGFIELMKLSFYPLRLMVKLGLFVKVLKQDLIDYFSKLVN